jgi:hypothetical protein
MGPNSRPIAAPILAAFGEQDVDRLRKSGIAGALVTRWQWQDRGGNSFGSGDRGARSVHYNKGVYARPPFNRRFTHARAGVGYDHEFRRALVNETTAITEAPLLEERNVDTVVHSRPATHLRLGTSHITNCALPPSCNRDRAAVVAQALLQLVTAAPRQQLRVHLEELLRDEFAEVERQAIADRGHCNA